jgi:hypothetical protein
LTSRLKEKIARENDFISGEGINNITLLECFLALPTRSSENDNFKVKRNRIARNRSLRREKQSRFGYSDD